MLVRKAFVVGRKDHKSTTLIILRLDNTKTPVVGPWTLKAVVSRN
jgi:hypothetical protein